MKGPATHIADMNADAPARQPGRRPRRVSHPKEADYICHTVAQIDLTLAGMPPMMGQAFRTARANFVQRFRELAAGRS